jgi:hypothetical protein
MKEATLRSYKEKILRVLVHIQQNLDGPYDRLGETYARLCGRWAPRSGYELRSAPCLEEYLNSPECTAPEDLVTDVYVPLESQGAIGSASHRKPAERARHPGGVPRE